ncbi:MAG: ferrous iron transport protein B [Muribaculaceae bacterium]|nr:ferrous iron transport protein B [Muribaculaceae bacterium]
MRLSELKPGQSGVVVKTLGHGAFRKRVLEMGFIRGHVVHVLLQAPLNDPINYRIMGYEVSLRRSEAAMIEVVALEGEDCRQCEHLDERCAHCPVADIAHGSDRSDDQRPGCDTQQEEMKRIISSQSHIVNVALIGNPNCGKTSLFNIASGAKEHVGNYSGVTVDAKSGRFDYKGYTFNIVDLPGTYSLTTYSPEEMYVRRYLRDNTPDVIINVVDVSNLERNLYLSTELIDMDRSMVIALNMYDELRARGAELDYRTLGKMIGVPMVPVVSKTGEGVPELFDTVISVFEGRNDDVRHVHVNLGGDTEGALRQMVDLIKSEPGLSTHFSPRYTAIKLLEGDHEIEDRLTARKNSSDGPPTPGRGHQRHRLMLLRDKLRGRIEALHDEDITGMIAGAKYGFIAGALAETYTPGREQKSQATRVLDRLATNRFLGFPIFFLIMLFIFWATFFVGQYPMEWIETAVSFLSHLVEKTMPAGPLKDLIADGIIGGVGGVIVFLPNILILYFMISFMEDSGYMARAAFIMDKLMHKIGLHGKSFIPLVMGFGCNVPAVLATRSIESHSSRLITILINPFMSCSARLPVYVLIIGAFFPAHAALVFAGVYLTGILVAVITARMLRRFFFKKDETPFVMELPPYRLPTFRASVSHTWEKGRQYLKKMGGIILVASIIVWALNYFPLHNDAELAASEPASSLLTDDSAIDTSRDSYLEMAGKTLNPLMEPLGFSWRATVAALAGVPAKEIVVSTLGVLYTNDEAVENGRLASRLTAPRGPQHRPDFTAASALAFMIFILLYCPCTATVTAIARETGRWRYALFSIVYNTAVAWLVGLVVYKLAIMLT